MQLYERELVITQPEIPNAQIAHFACAVKDQLEPNEWPVRFVVSKTEAGFHHCELGVLRCDTGLPRRSIFDFEQRRSASRAGFNAVLMVPTGVHAEVGGHAGDAGPAARLLAGVCDRLVTHPNVVNGSDINEMPENAFYVEGSVLCRLLMGTAGLQPVRANRVLLAIDRHEDEAFTTAAINAYNAARACYGLDGPRVVVLDPPVRLVSEYTSSGRAAGRVENFGGFVQALEPFAGEFDALAISSVIEVPPEFHQDYFASEGEMVNPWGGVEAIFTHALSLLNDVPSAHSPMLESAEIEENDPGIVDPRLAAEAVSYTFLQCILKGLMRSPRIVSDREAMRESGVFTVRDVSALVIPDGCLGLPVLAALEQGIPVVAVRDPSNLMRNSLEHLPWAGGQFQVVANYLEAAGVLVALRQGVALDTLRRPLAMAPVTQVSTLPLSDKREKLRRPRSNGFHVER
jgi:hypothetical protein